MNRYKDTVTNVIGAICELLIGILLIISPVSFTSWIIIFIGIVLIIIGIVNIVEYFKSPPQVGVFERKLPIGILAVAGGLFFVFSPQWVISTFPVLTIFFGLGTLIGGVFKVEVAVNMIRLKLKHWGWATISAVLTLVCAIIILCYPLSSTAVLWYFVAISLIVEAIIDFIVAFLPPDDEPEL